MGFSFVAPFGRRQSALLFSDSWMFASGRIDPEFVGVHASAPWLQNTDLRQLGAEVFES